MSGHYTDEDVRQVANTLRRSHITRLSPATSVLLARAALDAVAPTIAARALREFADERVTIQTPARMSEDLHARADEIEGTP